MYNLVAQRLVFRGLNIARRGILIHVLVKSDKTKRSSRQEEPVYIFCSEKYVIYLNGSKKSFTFGVLFCGSGY